FQNNIDGNTVSADVYRYTGSKWGATLYDNHAIANEKVGTAKLTFTSDTTAIFEYNVSNSSRSVKLIKIE
ncbi:MAG: hypothetical protein LBB65_04630, partial [Burkholderiales bacterium]|nr:hypothetical protein [Burkholderiales bacterium]